MILLTAALARSCCCGKKVFPAVAYDFEILGVDGQIAVISDRTCDMIRKAYFHDSANCCAVISGREMEPGNYKRFCDAYCG